MTIYAGHIKGDLTLFKGDNAKAVTSIGGSLYVSEGATCNLPAVTSIGGYPVPEPEVAKARMVAIANAALAAPGNLKMDKWHDESNACRTCHCIAGWAVHLEPGGYDLENRLGSTLLAGNVLLGPEYSKLFFLSDDGGHSALEYLLKAAQAEASNV